MDGEDAYGLRRAILRLINAGDKDIIKGMRKYPLISADPRVMTGRHCIRGTRVTVANVVRQVAAGRSTEQICHDYPYLTPESVAAALTFAADLASTETIDLMAS